MMGFGCPDRAALIVGQWAKTDVKFKHWAEFMDVGEEESPAWSYAAHVILTPFADWVGKVWRFWTRCLFVSHRSVESSEIENYDSP